MLNPYSVVWKTAMEAKNSVDKFNFRVSFQQEFEVANDPSCWDPSSDWECVGPQTTSQYVYRVMVASWEALLSCSL